MIPIPRREARHRLSPELGRARPKSDRYAGVLFSAGAGDTKMNTVRSAVGVARLPASDGGATMHPRTVFAAALSV